MTDNPTGQEMKTLRLHLRDCPRCQGQRGDCPDPEVHRRAVEVFAALVGFDVFGRPRVPLWTYGTSTL